MTIHKQHFDRSFEKKWYEKWLESKCFKSSPNPDKEPYTVVMPPPNVTGVLHMGHVLNNTIQDILVRRARMLGKETCWVPGTDHAAIATEAKVVALLKEKGVDKERIGREEFLKHAWEWKEKYGGIILKQLREIGASCDWDRTRFTLEEKLSKAVIQSFVELYEQGFIYRGNRMINWDPQGQTALSDDEVIHKEQDGKLYHIRYKISGIDKYIIIATSRPETIMGDTAVCINPKDERYQHLKGKKAIVPLIDRVIPIIEDEYVSMEFGTGCLKVTPAHDHNDYELGKKHHLETIEIFDDNARLNHNAQIYVGMDRFEARKKIIEELTEKDLLEKVEIYKQNLGCSERTNAVVEPKMSTQWFVSMKELAQPALENVMNDNIKFFPAKFKNMYRSWMENVRDWCISRQLWWGHQIPAYYLEDGTIIVAHTKEEALFKAKKETGNENLTSEDLVQDEDVLDTWFSSALWPISVFDGLEDPKNPDIEYYYPTNDLVTAPEIIFFWVARMIISGYKFRDELPFKNVYFTGIVRDKKGRKMSKSLGNSPDTFALLDKYGADGTRAGILFSAPAGNDILFDEKQCEQGRNFANKIINAQKLISLWQSSNIESLPRQEEAIQLFKAKFNSILNELNTKFETYRLSECLMIVYKLIWDDFCSELLETIKPLGSKEINEGILTEVKQCFENILTILHPFMPFITEELWHKINERDDNEFLTLHKWPEVKKYDNNIILEGEKAAQMVSAVRNFRKNHNISNKETLSFYFETNTPPWFLSFENTITFLGNIKYQKDNTANADLNVINIDKVKLCIEYKVTKDTHLESQKLEADLHYYKDFLACIDKKLGNSNFIQNAPERVIEMERKKKKDTEEKIKSLVETMNKYHSN